MWKLQGGSYIPGFSGQAFGAGLQRDVTKTRKDQAKKAAALNKYMSKRGAMGKWGGKIASGLLGAALGSTMGPVGLMLAKAGGAGIGSLIGGSKMLAGEGPSMKPGAGTGLLGSTYEQLGEAKGGIDEAMRGQAMGAAGSQLMSGLTGMAGSELKSGFGKMLAGKGINIGASPELGGGLSADAKAFHESMGAGNLGKTLDALPSGAYDSGISPSMARMVPSAVSDIAPDVAIPDDSSWNVFGDYSNLSSVPGGNDMWAGGVDWPEYTGDELGFQPSQQGGYMQGYQEGGEANNGILSKLNQLSDMQKFYEGEGPKTESGDLKFGPKGMITREGLAERYNFPLEEAVFDTSYGEPGSGNMAIDISIPSNDELIKYQRSDGSMSGKEAEFQSKSVEAEQAMRKAFPDEYESLATDIGFGDYAGAAEKVGSGWLDMSPLERMRSKTSSLGSKKNIPSESDEKKQMMMKALGMEESEYDSFMKWKKSKGMQMGGMMPGGVSNALPYQEGGEAEDKLTFGQRFVKRFPSQHEDPERAAGQERGLTSLIDFLIPQSKLDVALSALPIGALGKVGKKGIKKLIKGKRSPYNEGRTNVDMQHYTDWPENVKDYIHPSIVDDVLPPRRRALGDIYDEEGRMLDLVEILESHGLQEGGYMPRYNLGGSVQQQPMAYQLGGLLKYKRSPMMG